MRLTPPQRRLRALILFCSVFALAGIASAWAAHDSCRDNPDGQPFNIGTNDSYVQDPITGGYVGVDLHNLQGDGADACFALPVGPNNGARLGVAHQGTATPGRTVTVESCMHTDFGGSNCGLLGFAPYGAEIGSTPNIPSDDCKCVEGTTVYFWPGGPFTLGLTGTGSYVGPPPNGESSGTFRNVYVHGAGGVTGYGTGPGTSGTNGVTVSNTNLYAAGTRVPIVGAGPTGVVITYYSGPPVQTTQNPAGVAVCGPTITVLRDGQVLEQVPVWATAGSESC